MNLPFYPHLGDDDKAVVFRMGKVNQPQQTMGLTAVLFICDLYAVTDFLVVLEIDRHRVTEGVAAKLLCGLIHNVGRYVGIYGAKIFTKDVG